MLIVGTVVVIVSGLAVAEGIGGLVRGRRKRFLPELSLLRKAKSPIDLRLASTSEVLAGLGGWGLVWAIQTDFASRYPETYSRVLLGYMVPLWVFGLVRFVIYIRSRIHGRRPRGRLQPR